MNRKYDVKRYGDTYTKIEDTDWNKCYYCRDKAETKDHVPAISQAAAVPGSQRYIVPACHDCNSRLNNRGFTILERAGMLLDSLEDKYADLLDMPEWEDWEIEELGYNMRTKIEEDMLMKGFIEFRIANIQVILGLDLPAENED